MYQVQSYLKHSKNNTGFSERGPKGTFSTSIFCLSPNNFCKKKKHKAVLDGHQFCHTVSIPYNKLTCTTWKLEIWNGQPILYCIFILLNSCLLSKITFESNSWCWENSEVDWWKEGRTNYSSLSSHVILQPKNTSGLPVVQRSCQNLAPIWKG